MIAIRNADGTLVPVLDNKAGLSTSISLSLAHSRQKRAEIRLYDIVPGTQPVHIRDLPEDRPFGVLSLGKLPENLFGELEISAELMVGKGSLSIRAQAEGIKPVSGRFRIPDGAGDEPDDGLDAIRVDEALSGNHEVRPRSGSALIGASVVLYLVSAVELIIYLAKRL